MELILTNAKACHAAFALDGGPTMIPCSDWYREGAPGNDGMLFSGGMMTIVAKGKLFLFFWRLAYTHPRTHSTTLLSSFENDASPHTPLCQNI